MNVRERTLEERAERAGIRLTEPGPRCSSCGLEHTGHCELKPVKAQIMDQVAFLEFEQFKYPDNEATRRVISEIRQLALDQITSDVYSTAQAQRDRVGRDWVTHFETESETYQMFPSRTEEQEALALGLDPFLDRLSPEERALVRLHFDGRETHDEIAKRFNTSRPNISQRLSRIYEKLRQMIEVDFAREEVVDV